MVEAWNFNQWEAKGAFEAALLLDPACSRCWWGVAYALGPGANRFAFLLSLRFVDALMGYIWQRVYRYGGRVHCKL